MKNMILIVSLMAVLGTLGETSNVIRMETRSGFGGRIAASYDAIGSMYGFETAYLYPSEFADGWSTVAVQDCSADVFVMKTPAVEGGRLYGKNLWSSDRIHVVRDNVVVSDGARLVLEYGCIVKFTEGARIYVEDGGRLVSRGAVLTDIADDSAGGDTNLDGNRTTPSGAAWWEDDPCIARLQKYDDADGVRRVYSPGIRDSDLSIGDSRLPSATEMVDYTAQLPGGGGTGACSWSVPAEYYRITTEAGSYAENGVAQGWFENDGEWEFPLPFPFACFGQTYFSVTVTDDAGLLLWNDMGFVLIKLGDGDLVSLGLDQDVYIESDSSHVTFRWSRQLGSDWSTAADCSLTLYSDGTIRGAFGDCPDDFRVAQINNGWQYYAFSRSEDGGDIVFRPQCLPPGLSLDSETGTINGVPELSGHYEFEIELEDEAGAVRRKSMAIDVAANENRRPVVTDSLPHEESVITRMDEVVEFAVKAIDPEAGALTYRWYLDDIEIAGADSHAYEFRSELVERGYHYLVCEVSDGLWTVMSRKWLINRGGEIYVTGDDGEDALQRALYSVFDGDVIHVGPGVYSSISTYSHSRVRIVATGGSENTIIDGGGNCQCVNFEFGSTDTNLMNRIEGFTLRNGCANNGGGAANVWLVRCVLLDNVADAYGGGLYNGRADSCLFRGNYAYDRGGAAAFSSLYNCTVIDNDEFHQAGGAVCGGQCVNSILWGNSGNADPGNDLTDPLFLDPGRGNYRLSANSPCIGMGDSSEVAFEYDLDGNPRIQNGTVDRGAFESSFELPVPDAVSGMQVVPTSTRVQLDWSPSRYAKVYGVYRVQAGSDDSAAELISTTDCRYFDDRTAQSGVEYSYWVVPANEMGTGQRSEIIRGSLLAPLEIVDSGIGSGSVGMAYSFGLKARGGDGDYSWLVPVFREMNLRENTFAETGVPMGWKDDDSVWTFPLPFAFPFDGHFIDRIEVSDNGYIGFDVGDDYAEIYAAMDVDLLASRGDIFVSSGPEAVTIRWKRVIYDVHSSVDVSLTLYADGHVRLSGRKGTDPLRCGYDYLVRRSWSVGSGDILLSPNQLPPGLVMDGAGVITGVPAVADGYQLLVMIEDGNGESTTRELHGLIDDVGQPGGFVLFASGGGEGGMKPLRLPVNGVRNLPHCQFLPPAGRTRFAGWQGSNGRHYDDGVLVFNLCRPGETVTLTAIWE